MTGLTVLTEVPGYMARVHRLLEVRLVALHAIRVHQLVIAIGMAGLAGLGRVSARQCEFRRAVIERRGCPRRRRVTRLTVLAESSCRVTGRYSTLEICLMALVTIGVHQLVVIVGVTCLACLSRVGTGECKLRRIVIK
jgi:hypothetical protein